MAKLTRFSLKASILGGATYYTSRLGFWEGSEKTEIIFKDAYSLSSNYVSDLPVEMPELPKAKELTSLVTESWNSGVLTTFKFLSELPENTLSLANRSYQYISSFTNSPSE